MLKLKKIPGYPEIYRASPNGFIWTVTFSGTTKLKSYPSHDGYLRVSVIRGGKWRIEKVHRLALEAFVGPCPAGMQARHFPDNDRTNNSINNLSWSTPLVNSRDKHQHETTVHGASHVRSKLTSNAVVAIRRRVAAGEFMTDLAKEFGVSDMSIRSAATGVTWKRVSEPPVTFDWRPARSRGRSHLDSLRASQARPAEEGKG